MQVFLSIVFWLLMGCATAYFANQRGRDPLVWFMLGMLLGLFGLLLLFLLPPVADEMPTEEAEYALLDQKHEGVPSVQSHDYLIKEWYYYDTAQQRQGPVRVETLKSLWSDGMLNEETFIWCEGMDNWKSIDQVQNLYTYLQLS